MLETLKYFEITVAEESPKDWKLSMSDVMNVPAEKLLLNFKEI